MRQDSSVPTCTVQRRNGAFCDAPANEGMPYPICPRHAIKLWRHMDATLKAAEPRNPAGRRTAGKEGVNAVVYYIRTGRFIKIGVTVNLEQRLKSYPPDRVVLATEPGGYALEEFRINQFADQLAANREWFTPGGALEEHINALASTQAAAA